VLPKASWTGASNPSTLTRGTTVTVTAPRIARADAELDDSSRMSSTAPSLTTYSSPCCWAMTMIPRGPSPMVATGIALPVLLALGAADSTIAPRPAAWICSRVFQSCS
jgi:hypothetical protein